MYNSYLEISFEYLIYLNLYIRYLFSLIKRFFFLLLIFELRISFTKFSVFFLSIYIDESEDSIYSNKESLLLRYNNYK